MALADTYNDPALKLPNFTDFTVRDALAYNFSIGGTVVLAGGRTIACDAIGFMALPSGAATATWSTFVPIANNSNVFGFTSGGTTEIKPGMRIGVNANGLSTIVAVTVTSGTWAGGDAAGFIKTNPNDSVKLSSGVVSRATFANAGNITASANLVLYNQAGNTQISSNACTSQTSGNGGATTGGTVWTSTLFPSGAFIPVSFSYALTAADAKVIVFLRA